MKLCKDCVHFVPEHSWGGGSLLPGAFFYQEALCTHPDSGKEVVDLVNGNHRTLNMGCTRNRGNEDACGHSGKWFDPANLDGRLAMLEDK